MPEYEERMEKMNEAGSLIDEADTATVNEYPETVEYNLNNSSWTEITDDLGSGTTSTIIPASSFMQGSNTLQLRESNTFSTRFDWVLYIDQGVSPESFTTSYTNDGYGNITSVTDAVDNTTFLGYDSNHTYLTSITNALNYTLFATYDSSTGWLSSITDPKGNVSSFQYDAAGRVTKKINPDLSELQAVYNDQNNTVTIYDELDYYAIYYYDGLDRETKTEWYLSPTVCFTETFSLNYLNKIETWIDPGGHVYTYEYDSRGRPTVFMNPDSTFREILYDDTSNTTSVIDESNHKKMYHYDWVGNLLWVREYTDPMNYYLTQYTYDELRNMLSLTDAANNTTFYKYDSPFGVAEVKYPDLTAEMFSYNAIGKMSQKTDANGTTTFTYDAACQLIEVNYPDLASVTFEYDANGSRTLMVDSEGASSYIYDNRDRCISETRVIDGQLYTVGYTFDAASRPVSVTYPDQSVITYQYDSLDRLITIPGYGEFVYDADSQLTSMTYANGVVTSCEYDNRHRPVTDPSLFKQKRMIQTF
jgi:YD repeat-containing protein